MRMAWSAFLWVSCGLFATVAEGQTLSDADRLTYAQRFGVAVFFFDKAAAIATDEMKKVVPSASLPTTSGGMLVEPLEDARFRVVFYRGELDSAEVYFVAELRDGRVTKKTFHERPLPLSAAQASLARASGAAAKVAVDSGYTPCTRLPFNPVVIPMGADGTAAVYLLSPQIEADDYPMGGHFRIAVDGEGRLLGSRPLTRGCISTRDAAKDMPPGAIALAAFISAPMDDTPTELHVFLSFALQKPVYVATRDGRLWQVDKVEISEVKR